MAIDYSQVASEKLVSNIDIVDSELHERLASVSDAADQVLLRITEREKNLIRHLTHSVKNPSFSYTFE